MTFGWLFGACALAGAGSNDAGTVDDVQLPLRMPKVVSELLTQNHAIDLAGDEVHAPHARPVNSRPPLSQLLAGVPAATQGRLKRLQDAAASMQSDVGALSAAKSSDEALRLLSGIVTAYQSAAEPP